MGKSLRSWASTTWGEEVTSVHCITSLIQSNSSASLLLMKDGIYDLTVAGSLVDQESSSSDFAVDAGRLVDWIFDMVRRFQFRWSGMLRVIPLAIASQADTEFLHAGLGVLLHRSWPVAGNISKKLVLDGLPKIGGESSTDSLCGGGFPRNTHYGCDVGRKPA